MSKMLNFDCADLESPCFKWAETVEELKQSFALVHNEYLECGYIKEPDPNGLYFIRHSLLPETATLLIENDSEAVATLTQVQDTKAYGLPMDQIYRSELNELRGQGRKIAELCALATTKKLRWQSLYMHLFRAMYTHALCSGVDDFCIMVNPKHVRFYKMILLFEELGCEKCYPNLGVPAVALRAKLTNMKDRLKEIYGALDCECNLYSYMHAFDSSSNPHQTIDDDLLSPIGDPHRVIPNVRRNFEYHAAV